MTEHTALGDQNSILAKVFPLPKTGEEAKGSFSVDGWMDPKTSKLYFDP